MMTTYLCEGRRDTTVLMVETGGFGGKWHYTCCLANALSEHGININVVVMFI